MSRLKWEKDEDGDHIAKYGPFIFSLEYTDWSAVRGWIVYVQLDLKNYEPGGGLAKKYKTIDGAKRAAKSALTSIIGEIEKAGE